MLGLLWWGIETHCWWNISRHYDRRSHQQPKISHTDRELAGSDLMTATLIHILLWFGFNCHMQKSGEHIKPVPHRCRMHKCLLLLSRWKYRRWFHKDPSLKITLVLSNQVLPLWMYMTMISGDSKQHNRKWSMLLAQINRYMPSSRAMYGLQKKLAC